MINPIKQLFKFKTFFWSMLAISSPLFADCGSCNEHEQEADLYCCFEPLVEVKTGYFFFSDSQMRQIYKSGGWDIQLCASYPFLQLTDRWTLNAYGAVEYLQLCGRSINDNQKTSLWSIPVNIGLKPVFAINANTEYYFAIGPRYFYIHQHNNSDYVARNKSKNGLGFFVNTGLNYFLCECLVIDIFGEYSYANTHFHSGNPVVYTRNTQMGGFTFGAGLGYEF